MRCVLLFIFSSRRRHRGCVLVTGGQTCALPNSARIGVATADLYPRITLGGSVGSTGTGFGDVFGGGPLRWLLGPLLNWAFPNQEPARARIAAAEADTQASLAEFDGIVLRALEETETALTSYARALEQRQALRAARDQAERAARIGRAKPPEGAPDSLEWPDADRPFADTAAVPAPPQPPRPSAP